MTNIYFVKMKTENGSSIMRVKADNEESAKVQAIKQSLDKNGTIAELRFLYAI